MSESTWTPPAEGVMCWIEIPFADIAAGKKFYSAVFPKWEWREASEDHKKEDVEMFSYPNNKMMGGGIMKVPAECKTTEQKRGVGYTIYHFVNSVDETAKRVEQLGGKIVGEKHPEGKNGFYINVTDPEGNRFGLYEWVSDKKPEA